MRILGIVLAAAAAVLLPASAATASVAYPDDPGREITRWDQTFTLQEDGSVDVRLEFDFDFGNEPGHGPYIVLVTRQGTDDGEWDRLYPVSDFTAESTTGAPDNVYRSDYRDYFEVRIGDENVGDVSGVQTYVVTYTVGSVANATTAEETGDADLVGDEFYWNAVGDGWVVPISNATVTVVSPGEVTAAACYAGYTGYETPCTGMSVDGNTATFTQDYLWAGQPFSVLTLSPAGSMSTEPALIEHSDLKRAFSVSWWSVGGALAILGVGLVILIRRLRTVAMDDQFAGLTPGLLPVGDADGEVVKRDYRAPVAVQFAPPVGMRPGQLGTLVDEKADPRDVTATLVDLAVRGYLRIDEADRASWGLAGTTETDYNLVKLREPDAALFPFEESLLNSIFLGRTEVLMSSLKTTFASSMALVQSKLYDNVTQLGWFRSNPRTARGLWAGAGVGLLLAGIAGTIVLAGTTRFAFLPVPLILLGGITLATTMNAPARTAKGTAVLQEARGFELYISKAEANQLKFEEGEDLFSKYLPYAIAFGVAKEWAHKFEELARQGRALAEPTWYTGFAYGAFWANSGGLGDRMASFASVAATAMSTPTPSSSGGSGFGGGGGGFSGGGGGGGGGGGW